MANHVEPPAAVGELFRRRLITSIHQPPVRSGKEATVYRCAAHARTGTRWFALKAYRPAEVRAFRHDAVYRVGRTSGQTRVDRAIAARSAFGLEAMTRAWARDEHDALRRIHAAGGSVPRPISQVPDAVLMEWIGDDEPAPQLRSVSLAAADLGRCWQRLHDTIRIALACGRVHGDLSPYNVLWWRDRPIVIDLPQAVDPLVNDNAAWLLRRDLENLARWFGPRGLSIDVEATWLELWPH